MKKCSRCKVEKPLDQFYSNKSTKSGKADYCKDCVSATKHKYVKPETVRRNKLSYKYGITQERYDEMLLTQNGVCAICGGSDSRALNVDHNHMCCPDTKTCGNCIRELLCRKCNMAIGLLNDDILLLKKVIAYLEKWEGDNDEDDNS